MEGSSQPLRHIVINDKGSPEKFTTPNSGGRQFQFNPRDRQQHGESLKEQLQETARQAEEQAQTVPSYQVIEKGFYIEFESDPGYELKVDSLKDGRQCIRLVAVSERINADGSKVMKATVLEEWTQDYETVVDGLPEKFHAKLAWHKSRVELGILVFVRIGEDPKKQVSFYLKPDPEKVKKRYRINPYKPKSE